MANIAFRAIISYILDYVIIIAFGIGFALLDKIEPFNQHFSLNNYTLQYPYAKEERVPIWQAGVIVVGGPLIVILVWTIIVDGIFSHHIPPKYPQSRRRMYGGGSFGWRGHTLKDRLWELNCGILGLFLAVSGALVVTQALKNAAGKPRPDFISRCKPRDGSRDPPVFGLSNSSICTETDRHIMWDGFRSWPSGHSSTAFAGLGYLSFYLTGKLHVLDTRGEVWKTVIVLFPLLGAALIAVSRIMDARHHPFDVITGSMLGFLMAWAAYRQYFPPLHETWRKGRAYGIRTWGRDPVLRKMEEDKAIGRDPTADFHDYAGSERVAVEDEEEIRRQGTGADTEYRGAHGGMGGGSPGGLHREGTSATGVSGITSVSKEGRRYVPAAQDEEDIGRMQPGVNNNGRWGPTESFEMQRTTNGRERLDG